MLIVARAVQGLGASLMTPQTMAVITRIFPPDRRGAAMGLWGAVAGVASLVGPILGGVLVDSLGWEWIFFINVPIGVVGFVIAVKYVPALPTHPHRFDIVGVVLSAIGLFCLVFGIQEGQTYNWGTIVGPISVWGLIITGIVVLAVFAVWQAVNRGEPLLPLKLFRDRNFSLANFGITAVGLRGHQHVAADHAVRADRARTHPHRGRAAAGADGRASTAPCRRWSASSPTTCIRAMSPRRACCAWPADCYWLSTMMTPDVPIWHLLFPIAMLGLANAGMWSPLSTTATRNLPPWLAGAGVGRLQHDPADRLRARQRRYRRAHAGADLGRAPRRLRGTDRRAGRPARRPARRVLRRDGTVAVAAGRRDRSSARSRACSSPARRGPDGTRRPGTSARSALPIPAPGA